MMTKKDYNRAVEIIREHSLPGIRNHQIRRDSMINAFCELFQGDNPRFDSLRFRKACGYASDLGLDEPK